MRLVRRLVIVTLGVLPGAALAQSSVPNPPAPTCEAQLEAAQAQAIQLRKEKAQAEFQGAAVEEFARACKKQLDASKPTPETPKVGAAPKAPEKK